MTHVRRLRWIAGVAGFGRAVPMAIEQFENAHLRGPTRYKRGGLT
jgi:hypothetical protein